MNFSSKSQAQQDVFVWLLTHQKKDGVFLDIGSQNPVIINNTYELEKQGWTGFSFDIDNSWSNSFKLLRKTPFICTDVCTFDWHSFIENNNLNDKRFDYLSFDVDEASMRTMRRFPFDKISFNICTVEHDRYRFGQDIANEMRQIMERNDYILLCKDVTNDNLPYEDWWVHKTFYESNGLNKFYFDGLGWKDIIKSIQKDY